MTATIFGPGIARACVMAVLLAGLVFAGLAPGAVAPCHRDGNPLDCPSVIVGPLTVWADVHLEEGSVEVGASVGP
ncbi:MAG: hypothetical protein ACT4PT_04400 [Methanobacteriota archaeon]